MSFLVAWGQSMAPADDQPILTPQCVEMFSGRDVLQIVCGTRHNLFVMGDGAVYAQGNNSFGQLGYKRQDQTHKTEPILVTALDAQKIRMVDCGEDFSIAVNDEGQAFSWGKNSDGQTAQDRSDGPPYTSIKLIRGLNGHRLEGVACGLRHVLAFTEASCVFAWGCNRYGQLGLGRREVTFTSRPHEVEPLRLLPVRHVSAGGSHSFCLSVSGVLFGWGRNAEGQLGLGSDANQYAPVELERLRNRHVVHVACGDLHSVVRTEDGAVFSFGGADSGQLGHGDRRRRFQPQQIQELMGSKVTQIACGRAHTLAVVACKGAVYVFGSGAHGQLGLGHLEDKLLPTKVPNLWTSSATFPPQLHWTACGGNTSFALGQPCNKLFAPPGQPKLEARELPLATVDFDLVKCLKSPTARDRHLCHLKTVLSSPACLVTCCLDEPHFDPRPAACGLNLQVASKLTAEIVAALSDDEVDRVVQPSLMRLLGRCEEVGDQPMCDLECLRVALLLPVTVFMRQPRFADFQARFARYLLLLVSPEKALGRVLATWLSACTAPLFNRIIQAFKDAAAFVFALPSGQSEFETEERHSTLKTFFEVLAFFNKLNTRQGRRPKVAAEVFYLPEIIDHIDIKCDLYGWRQDLQRPDGVRLRYCNFLFLFNGQAKSQLLMEFAKIEMHYHVTLARRSASASTEPLPFTSLRVRRHHLVEDTLDALEQMTVSDFKKQLNIFFVGEEAIDEGGVKKEFFLILFREILDPKYGMFELDEESKMLWFRPNSFEGEEIYLMIGRLLGLAIYNSILVTLNFPLALFKKILGYQVDFDDLVELKPDVGKSMKYLIDFDGSPNENIFDLNFTVTESIVGGPPRVVPLVPNGANIAVTKANREEYVRQRVDHLFNRSCEREFKALKKGFYEVCGEYLGRLFRPKELQEVVRGSEEYDWDLLKTNATYSGILTEQHELVVWFWQIFDNMSDEKRKKLLLFITGSDRVPLVGMSAIRLEICVLPRSTDHHFPIAHTCASILEMPLYSSKSVLERQVLTAILHSEGFGIE